MKKKITREQFEEALFHAVKEFWLTDLTDYDNWMGIRDFCRFAWRCLDKKYRWHKKKLSDKPPKRYRKLFGRFYIRDK